MAEKIMQKQPAQKVETFPMTLCGTVVSDKMDKTIVVKVERTSVHPLYGKVVFFVKKYKAHDEEGKAKIGDKVEIVECRPLSKTKFMKLAQIIGRAD